MSSQCHKWVLAKYEEAGKQAKSWGKDLGHLSEEDTFIACYTWDLSFHTFLYAQTNMCMYMYAYIHTYASTHLYEYILLFFNIFILVLYILCF